jgi:hypothetical protein
MSAFLFLRNKGKIRDDRDLLVVIRLAVNGDTKAVQKQMEQWERELR